jgi:hypothetical protein
MVPPKRVSYYYLVFIDRISFPNPVLNRPSNFPHLLLNHMSLILFQIACQILNLPLLRNLPQPNSIFCVVNPMANNLPNLFLLHHSPLILFPDAGPDKRAPHDRLYGEHGIDFPVFDS